MAATTTPLDIGVFGARGVPSTYSGYETFLTLLLPELARRGDAVTMYCRSGEGFESTEWRGVNRVVLPAIAGKNSSTLSHGAVAAAAARRARHDVVLVVNVANAAFCLLSRATGQAIVLNVDGQEWRRGKWGTTAKKIFLSSAKIARRTATALISDGVAMADIYRDEFSSESTVIPYCVTTGDWVANPLNVRNRELEPGRYAIVAGRHNPENNIAEIAESFHRSGLPIDLAVLGTANYDSPVTARISELCESDERIRLVGHVGERNEFFDLLHHAAVYIHGHSVGGTNPSLVEAMGAGARICAFDTAFNRETLGPDAAIFTLAPDTLATQLSSIIADPPEVDAAHRAAANARAEDVYSVDRVVSAYRDLLVAATERPRRTGVTIDTFWS